MPVGSVGLIKMFVVASFKRGHIEPAMIESKK